MEVIRRRRSAARRPSPRRLRRGLRRGFTLISVIIALILLSVGVMALAGANAAALRTFNREGVRSTALEIARAHLERLRGINPSLLASETGVRVNALGDPDVAGTFTRTVTVAATGDTALVSLTVTVRPDAAVSPVALQTLIYRPIW
jgi:type IV pilus assembly protein PilV